MLEIFTLLNPKVANYTSSGGIPAIVPEDVAACLGRIPIEGPALLVRTMAGDLSSRRPLDQIFRQNVALMASQKFWKTGPKYLDYFDGLVDCVLHFYLLPDTCGRCHGHGHITRRDTQVIVCPVCEGIGHREAKEADKARAAAIPMSTWADTWADRYTAARDILTVWEGMADHAAKRLYWEDVN